MTEEILLRWCPLCDVVEIPPERLLCDRCRKTVRWNISVAQNPELVLIEGKYTFEQVQGFIDWAEQVFRPIWHDYLKVLVKAYGVSEAIEKMAKTEEILGLDPKKLWSE